MIAYSDLLDQNPWWQEAHVPEEAELPRRVCFGELCHGLDRSFTQVLLGIRRVGKSTLVRQLIADLLHRGVDARRILYFSFDRYAVEKTPEALETVIRLFLKQVRREEVHQLKERCYLFIDEVQYIDYWADIVKRFYDRSKRLKFILTGSQSCKLRGKSKGSLAGRLLEYHLPPLSFPEYGLVVGRRHESPPPVFNLSENDWLPDVQEYVHRAGDEIRRQMPGYLCFGQFPEVASEPNLDISYRYLREAVLGKVLESDLPEHYGIERVEAFKAMAYHLIVNSGSLFELINVGSDLGIAKATAEKYLGYLRESTLVNVVHNLTRSEIKRGRSLRKSYAGSTCFMSAINRYPPSLCELAPEVFGKLVETYVWWRLAETFSNVDFWRRRQDEVDFVVTQEDGSIVPIEVKFTARIRPGDLQPLIRFMDRKGINRGYVLTRNRADTFTIESKQLRLMPYYLL